MPVYSYQIWAVLKALMFTGRQILLMGRPLLIVQYLPVNGKNPICGCQVE